MADTYPQKCSTLKKNGYAIIKGQPCKIVELSTNGEQINIVALDVFTQKKFEDNFHSAETIDVPNINHQDYQVMLVEDVNIQLMVDNGDIITMPFGDSHVDQELREEIRKKFNTGEQFLVTVLSAMGKEKIVATKVLA